MLEKIKFNYKVAENPKSKKFTNAHEIYNCSISYNGKKHSFEYQCNPKYNKPTISDVMNCLTSDSFYYEQSRDLKDFAEELGYSIEEAKKPFKLCKKTSEALHRMFTDDELDHIVDDLFYTT